MAMGLRFLGRGRTEKAAIIVLHIVGAAVGGAALGAGFGLFGRALGLPAWRPWVIAAAAVAAAWLAIRRPQAELGIKCQVPRHLAQTTFAGLRYSVWGGMLGSGVATLIPYSAYLIVIGVELTVGPWLGAAAGAAFGIAREGLIIAAASWRFDERRTLRLFTTARPQAERLNRVVSIAGGAALVALAIVGHA